MDAISQMRTKSSQLSDIPLWVKVLRDFVLLSLFMFCAFALIDPFHHRLTDPYHAPGKNVWSYFWQASFVSGATLLAKYVQKKIMRTI
jgi:hypothetical protein